MGGGVIIKPVFDSIGFHTLSAITFIRQLRFYDVDFFDV